jgi:two-component system OmpR family sensor kinase
MSLRVRLVVVVLVLTGVGLVISGVATSSALHSYLLKRVDDRLSGVEPFAVRRLAEPAVGTSPAPSEVITSGAVAPQGFNGDVFAARYDASGNVVREFASPFSNAAGILRAVPTSVLARGRSGRTDWSEDTIDGTRYRVIVEPIPNSTDVAVVLAPLSEINATVSRLRWLEIGVGIALLVLATGVGLWLVRIGLRPLGDMADAADAIAEGDLDRRVEARGKGEVEHLAHALNNAFDARQTSEEKLRRFVTDASHELRTPLTSIRGYSELLRRGALSDPEEGARAVSRIEDEAARMGVLVDDLSLLARLDQGRPLGWAPVDLAAIAVDAVSDARVVEPDRRVSCHCDGPVMVEGDEHRLRQVLANLLANTRDHTPAGTPVDVYVGSDGAQAVVVVTDEGPGLGTGEAEKVFDRFWRADAARGHRHGSTGGSGLGLAIVHAIVIAHGGRAAVDNAPGAGARFTIHLPLMNPTDEPGARTLTTNSKAGRSAVPDSAGRLQ